MPLSRRSFLTESAAAGCLSALLANSELAQAVTTASSTPPTQPTAGETYWKNLYAGAGTQARGGQESPNDSRDPRIVQYTDQTGLRWVEDIKVTELPSFSDDAVVTLEMTGFRAGSKDTSALAKVRFAQLHLSCQRVTGSEFLGPLVWAALATLFANKASSLPKASDLSWSSLASNPTRAPNQSQSQSQSSSPKLDHVVLNQGAGHMSVNVTSTPPTSLLDKILGVTMQTTKILAPLLGFPGIALPALENFYTFYGMLEKARPENFLLNSALMDVAVTQQGADNSLISANAIKLLSGSYILVPKSQEDDLQKEMDKLVVQNGYLVERDAKGTPDTRVAQAVPTVSYLVLNVKVQPASAFPATSTVTDPMLDSVKPASPTTPVKKSK